MQKNEFRSMNEVIAITNLSRSTILRLQGRGEFPPRRALSGRSVGILASEIDEWVATRVARI